MLNGGLEVESELGTGSTFRLSLPATADAPAQRASKHGDASDAAPSDVAHVAG
jgi:hypothetical protein